MYARREAPNNLGIRVLFFAIVVLGLILINWPVSPAHPLATTAQQAAPFPPEGDWYTYANGDDILVLVTQGDILWAGTRAGGLVRWDTTDHGFVQFLRPQDGLVGNTVRDIYIDANGHKWLATDHGLSVLDDKGTADKADDEWYTYTRATTNGNLPSNRVTAVAMDQAGFLWIGTGQYWDNEAQAYVGGGLAWVDTKGNLDPADDEWLHTYTVENTITHNRDEIILGLASDNITDILPVPGKRVWIATQTHWAYRQFTTEDGTVGQWRLIYGGLSRLDHNGTPDPGDDTWKAWTCEAGPQRDTGVSCIINQLRLDTNGYIWAAQRSRGVIAFPYNGDRSLDYVRFDKYDGLESNDVESVTFGPSDDPRWQNTVWFGTYDASGGYGRGVSVLDHNGTIKNEDDDTWNEWTPSPGEAITTANGLPDDQVQAMVTGGGRIWMGTGGRFGAGNGIVAFDPGRRAFQESLGTTGADPETGLSRVLPYNYIIDLAVGQPGTRWENQVWVATGNKRQRKYGVGALLLDTQGTQDPADDTWTQFTKESTDSDGKKPWTGLASNNVTAIATDGEYVWLGTQSVTWDNRFGWTDGGLSVYDGEQWTVRTDANTGGQYAGMLDDRISALAVGCTGELWIALGNPRDSSGIGINVVDTNGAPHNLNNDVWWDPIQYPTIPSNLVTGIATDCSRHQLWISAASYFGCRNDVCMTKGGGVARYDYGTRRWTSWNTRDGIESFTDNNINGELMSIAVGPDGTVWAGAWGTRTLSRQKLIDNWPYVPATISWLRNGVWSSRVFENSGWVSSIALDENGVVWVATSRGGLDIDPPDGEENDSLPDQAIGGIKLTVDGTEWVSWTPDNSPLVTNDIGVITVAPDGDVWIGTNGWGIMRFHPKEPATPTPTATETSTATVTPSITVTPAVSFTPTPTATPTPSPTETLPPIPPQRLHQVYMSMVARDWFGRPIFVPTAAPPTATPTPSQTPPVTWTPTPTSTPTITNTPTDGLPPATSTPTPTITNTLSPTSAPTVTATPTPIPTGVWCPGSSPACSDVIIPTFSEKDLFDVTFTDSLRGFIVGENGWVWRTNDGGNDWTAEQWGIETLRDIFMVSSQVGFIAGDNKTILRTTNGGGYFGRMEMPAVMIDEVEDFHAIYAFSQNDAWALGHQRGTILRLQGQAWEYIGWTGYPYTGLAMPAPDQGWAITEDGYIYRYNGTRWSESASELVSSPLRTIDMYSPTDGWAAGDGGVVAHYANGQWTQSLISGAFSGGGITGLYVRAADDVWATATIGTGEQADGAIYRYHGGRWKQVAYTHAGQLNAVWVNDTLTNGWAVGNNGFVMRYVIPSE